MNTGHRHWTIAKGWISPLGDETVAFLNTSLEEAHVQIFIYYSNRDPVGPYHLIVPPERMSRANLVKTPAGGNGRGNFLGCPAAWAADLKLCKFLG